MSVYTHISSTECQTLLSAYGYHYLGHEAIKSGIENSSFFVNIDSADGSHELILTIFESLAENDIHVLNMVLNHLKAQGLPVAPPLMQQNGAHIGYVQGKPAWLCHKLPGSHVTAPGTGHCHNIGSALAKMHKALQNPVVLNAVTPLMGEKDHPNTPQQWLSHFDTTQLSASEQGVVNQLNELCLRIGDLPKGLIHADLFTDNVLYVGPQVTGLIDFANLCYHDIIYDLAICINDFCSNSDGSLNPVLVSEFLQGYQQIRPLLIIELEQLPPYMALAAGRFWLSRCMQKPDAEAISVTKSPADMFAMLLMRLDHLN